VVHQLVDGAVRGPCHRAPTWNRSPRHVELSHPQIGAWPRRRSAWWGED
jgi:hypothetical protein